MPSADLHPGLDSLRLLMPHRVQRVLLVASQEEARALAGSADPLSAEGWTLQLDGSARVVRRVSTDREALQWLDREPVDLLLLTTRLAHRDPFAFSSLVKLTHPAVPIVLVVIDATQVAVLPPPAARASIDQVFAAGRSPELMSTIARQVEDRANVEHDARVAGVRVVLVVDGAPEFYSLFLTRLHAAIAELTRSLLGDRLSQVERLARTRSRAKVLYAETYEGAWRLYEKHGASMVGIVTDGELWRRGVLDPHAGSELTRAIKAQSPDLPMILQSCEPQEQRLRAQQLGAHFIDKNSPTSLNELRYILTEYMGFGDFVFRTRDGREAARAANVSELLTLLDRIPSESLLWHAERNHFSHWMAARAELSIADRLRPRRVEEFGDVDGLRRYMTDVIREVLAVSGDA